jgi:hypothetical protein
MSADEQYFFYLLRGYVTTLKVKGIPVTGLGGL